MGSAGNPHWNALSRRRLLHAGLATGAALTITGCASNKSAQASSASRPPNVIFIYADDMGYGDLGCYGNQTIRTPNLDRMAADGLRFTSFYSCGAVCTPSRAGLLTGRYQVRSGLPNVLFPDSKIGMPDSEITIAQALKQQGYATACIGKWHLGHLPQFLPTRHGFDQYLGIPYSNDMSIDPAMKLAKDCKFREGMTPERVRSDKPTKGWAPLFRGEEVIEYPVDQTQLTRRYTQEAIRFIEKNRNKPFFLYLPHSMPHVPLAASEDFKGKSKGGFYGDVIEELDWSVGQVLEALKKNGLDENTLVVFSSDNGPWLTQGKNGGSAGPLRNGKGTTFEGGVREPCIARWPGHIKPGRIENRPAIMLDWLPTFVTLASGRVPTDRIIDGKNIAPVLLGTGTRGEEDFYFFLGNTLQACRSGPWKLKLPIPGQARANATSRPAGQPLMLFNLDQDLRETKNMAREHPEIVQQLREKITAFKQTL